MRQLGVRHAYVVHGYVDSTHTAGMDETLHLRPHRSSGSLRGRCHLRPHHSRAGRPRTAPIESLRGGDAISNADILRAIFRGEHGPHRDVVLLNAAAVLITAGAIPPSPHFRHEALRAGIELAANTIDSGAVTALVAALGRTEL